jgi:hypothetical protein
MIPIQTYPDRQRTADPYAPFSERAEGKRANRQGSILRFSNLEVPTMFTTREHMTAALTGGSLSSIKILISYSAHGGLPEMLRSLESARNKADPYVEMNETIRASIGTSLEHRLAKMLDLTASRAPKTKPSLEEYLQPVLQLERRARIDSALDALYDRVDDSLKTGQIKTLDEMLREAKAGFFSTDILLGLLTATLPARSRLPARARFFADAEASIKARGEWEDGLLAGLES